MTPEKELDCLINPSIPPRMQPLDTYRQKVLDAEKRLLGGRRCTVQTIFVGSHGLLQSVDPKCCAQAADTAHGYAHTFIRAQKSPIA